MQRLTPAVHARCTRTQAEPRRMPQKPTRHPQTTKAPTPPSYISATPCASRSRKYHALNFSCQNECWSSDTKEGGRTPPCPTSTWPGKPSPERAPSQPPPPKPGFGFSRSCSLPNCSSLNSLLSSFLGEDLPRGMTAGCTTRRKLK